VPTEHLVSLPDGRSIAYFDLGDPQGHPVIHSHGAPSGKLETEFFGLDAAARDAGVRLLALDRPGVGGSDAHPGRTLLGWPDDVAAFADALGLDRFALFGYSIGAGSALACLQQLSGRISAAAIVSGAGPAQVPGLADGRAKDVARVLHFARHYPRLTNQVLKFMRWGTKNPAKMIAASGRSMPPADRAIADRPEAAAPFAAFIADAMRTGTAGVADDLRLIAAPWGFEPDPTEVPVTIWHGEADTNVPVAAARWLAERMPNSTLHVVPTGGHVSVLASQARDILQQLKERARV
jgi:pimeloyl-ACP methyl ester carboxylesterase